MNILFYVISLRPSSGGIERVTYMLSEELVKKGHNCFACYWREEHDQAESQHYSSILKEERFDRDSRARVCNFIQQHNIEIVINQFAEDKEVYNLMLSIKENTDVKIITALHQQPKYYENIKTLEALNFLPKSLNSFLYSLIKIRKRKERQHLTRQMYVISDAYVLLSESFFSDFLRYNRISDKTKLRAIPNPAVTTIPGNLTKEKALLYVGRLENEQKRVDRVLTIWKEFHSEGDGWKLYIVGDGKDRAILETMSRSLNLTDVTFEGFQSHPESFYAKSMIFIMTSDYEGWGMTLIEAMRYAVVPIAYDTYSSLHDIIEDGVNGTIISTSQKNVTSSLKNTINNYKNLSICAQNSISKFSTSEVCNKWLSLINTL